MMQQALHSSWRRTVSTLGLAPNPSVFNDVLNAYTAPHRHYHTLEHLAECIGLFEEIRSVCQYPGEVEWALWFHDAIYDPRAGDNELRSAHWSDSAAAGAGMAPASIRRIHELVLATRHAAQPFTPDQCHLVDMDLAILGAPTTRFEAYETQVRMEYVWVEDSHYRRERTRILQGFLDRPRIYLTRHFYDRFETSARHNLTLAIARLS